MFCVNVTTKASLQLYLGPCLAFLQGVLQGVKKFVLEFCTCFEQVHLLSLRFFTTAFTGT